MSRQWNVADNTRYIRALQEGNIPFEIEILTPAQRYNEYVMTGLRTIWGCEEQRINAMGEPMSAYFFLEIQAFMQAGHIEKRGGNYRLTPAGRLLADRIASGLFWVEQY
jgi:oxygen-independent coproporphyrinogen-3 oxidase